MEKHYDKKHKTLTYKTLTLFLLALLCLGGNRAWGQWAPGSTTLGGIPGTYRLRSKGDNTGHFDVYKDGYNNGAAIATNQSYINGFTINSGTVEYVFENTETITMDGQIFVNAEAGTQAHLIMRLGTPPTGTPAAITLKITGMSQQQSGSEQNVVFFLNKGKGANAGEHSITIQGNDDPASSTTDPSGLSFAKNFVIDGDGPELDTVNGTGTTMSPQVTIGPGDIKNYGMFRVQQGSLHLKNVTVQNFSTTWSNGGVAQVFTSNATDAVDLEFNHCLFKSIGATQNSPVLRMQGSGGTNDNRDARIVNCRFVNTFGSGGLATGSTTAIDNNNATIRTLGNNKVPLTLTNCHITNNYGCAVRWHGCGSSTPMIVNGCLIENNFTKSDTQQVFGGGGLLLKGPATITNCTIKNNRTDGNGGGIYLSTYIDFNDGTPGLVPDHSILSLDGQTVVSGNVAVVNGGGVAIEGKKMINTYGTLPSPNGPDGYIWFAPDGTPYTLGFTLGGATISGNKALNGHGGGVYMSSNEETTYFRLNCLLDKGTISGNFATSGNGGGVAVETATGANNPANIPSYVVPQDITLTVGEDAAGTSTVVIEDNKAMKGGGIYLNSTPLEYNGTTSEVSTTMLNRSTIRHNTATSDGGGLYVARGNVNIMTTQGTVKPTIGGASTTDGNTATDNGGGVYLKQGVVRVNQGLISHNTASGSGGGVYIDEGKFATDLTETEPTITYGGGVTPPTPPTPSGLLPTGYTQYEYISFGNNWWFDTNIQADASHTVYTDGYNSSNGEKALISAYVSNQNRFRISLLAGSDKIGVAWQKGGSGQGYIETTKATSGISIKERFQTTINKSRLVMKNETNFYTRTFLPGSISGTLGSNINWTLLKYGGTSSAIGNCVFYEAKIWAAGATIDPETGAVEGTLLAHYVPCKDPNGDYGVFNVLDQENGFIGNSGTGTNGDVSLGPVVGSKSSASAGGPSASSGTASAALTSGSRSATGAALGGCTITDNTAAVDGGGVYVNQGGIYLINSAINDNTATTGRGGGAYTNEGSICINYWPTPVENGDPIWAMRNETTATTINGNHAGGNGGGINTHTGQVFARGQAANQRIEIIGNKAGYGASGEAPYGGSGGGVFCMGLNTATDNDVYITMTNVNINENEAKGKGDTIVNIVDTDPNDPTQTVTTTVTVTNGAGGGVYLQHGKVDMNRANIELNKAATNGGGINNHQGALDLAGCVITGNTATGNESTNGSGGGVFTNTGRVTLTNHNEQGTVTVSTVTNNTAGLNGGGIVTRQGKVTVTGEANQPIDISNNTAGCSGGGIFCLGQSQTVATETYIDISHVTLRNNKANGSGDPLTIAGVQVSKGCGGGMYLQEGEIDATNVIMQNNYAKVNGGAINNHRGFVDIWGCRIGGSGYYDATSTDGTDLGNKADNNGGGIYTVEGDIDIEDIVVNGNGSVHHYESSITYNEAGQNGGGINTHSGTITINTREDNDRIEITNNKAYKGGAIYANQGTIIAHDALINNNTATLNGGGIDNRAGDITLYGGELNNNTAEQGKGGGAYTNVGDIRILPYPTTNTSPTIDDGTKIYNNIAKLNGGGINNHTGRVDIRHATIHNNTSTLGSGGGIYCEGPHGGSDDGLGYTIRLLNSEVTRNKTRGADGTDNAPTGRGGGIYLAYGSIFAQNSDILLNSANINGGGIDNRQGSILVYGCNIAGNTAVKGKGGGIYTQEGDITTGPITNPNNTAKSKATVIDGNTAKINGGGINNHNGNIYLNGDHITNNTADSLGGGIYIANGVIDMFGGKIENNVSNFGDGGGVWSGGGEFNIQKRQGKPVIQIIDVEDIKPTEGTTTYQAVIHYHLVDKGNNNATITHGIRYGLNSASTLSNDAEYGSTGVTCEQREAGCYRITITGLTANNTKYKAVAYANYNTGDPAETIEGVSDIVRFETFAAAPTVITGNATNITQNSAELSGKVIDEGTTSLNERGFYWGTSSTPATKETVELGIEYFQYDLNGLSPNTTYYFQAFANNGTETKGEVVSFKTTKAIPTLTGLPVVTNITHNSAQFTYTIPAQTAQIKRCGFVWSTDDDPDPLEDNSVDCTVPSGTNGAGQITLTLDPTIAEQLLNSATTYYVRAYAGYDETSHDPVDYAFTEPKQFITKDANNLPVVRAIHISNITQRAADVYGRIAHSGGDGTALSNVKMYGICYSSTNPNPTEHNNTNCTHIEIPTNGSWNIGADSTFHFHISGLEPNTTYYLRLYASNVQTGATEEQIAYSNDYNFSTLHRIPPTAVLNVENMTAGTVGGSDASADFTANFTNGGANYTKQGYKYGTYNASNQPTQTGTAEITTSLTDTKTWNLTGLTNGQYYWAVAYVNTDYGTNVSDTVKFTMPVVQPMLTMSTPMPGNTATDLTVALTATVNSSTAYDGTITRYGFLWSTQGNPVPTLGNMSDEVSCAAKSFNGDPNRGSFSYTITGDADKLYGNRTYYVRPFATTRPVAELDTLPCNDAQYAYGDVVSVLTLPKLTTASYANPAVTATTATLGFSSPSPTSPGFQSMGFCWTTGTDDPTYVANSTTNQVEYTDYTPSGTTGWSFSRVVEGFAGNTTYRWRAFVKNSQGNVAYSETREFTTQKFTLKFVAGTNPQGGSISVTGLGTNGTWDGTSAFTATATPLEGWVNGKFDCDLFEEGEYVENNIYTNIDFPTRLLTNYGTYVITHDFWTTIYVNKNGTGTIKEQSSQYPGQAAVAIALPYGPRTPGCEADGSVTYTYTAIPTSPATFVNWTDGNTGEVLCLTDAYAIPITGPINIVANFSDGTFTLNTGSSPTAGGTTTGSGTYSCGESRTVTATANAGYRFVNWTENGEVVSDQTNYTFNLTHNTALVANFEATGGSKNGSQTTRLQEGQQTGRRQARPRDIYPAPAREPWDWEEDDYNSTINRHGGQGSAIPAAVEETLNAGDCGAVPAMTARNAMMQSESITDTLPQAADDTLALLREQLSRDAVEPQDIPLIQYNRAYEGKGGGIYMENNDANNPTKLVFSGGDADNVGKIVYNYAKEAGGGIYIDKEAYMQMKGHCEVNANWVPAGKLGGGIYLAGRLYVGDKRNDGTNAHALKVNKNFAVDVDDVTVDEPTRITNLCASITQAEKTTLRNNIMLPRNTYDYGITANSDGDDQSTVITLLSDISAKDGDDNPYTQLGFSVISGFCPVIATSKKFSEAYLNQGEYDDGDDNGQNQWPFNKFNAGGDELSPVPTNYYEKWLSDLMPQGDGGVGALTDDGAIFEDSETYIAIHTDRNNQPFRAKYIYLWGSWTNPAVSEDPERNTGPNGTDMSMEGTGTHYRVTTDSDGKTHWEIYSEEGLSWFSSYVNGLNAFTPGNNAANPDPKHKDHEWEADKNPYATAKLMADLDMKAHLWVPIGSVSRFNGAAALTSSDPNSTIYTDDGNHTFKGEFDGQGHTIRGLDGRFLTGIQKYGLFGHLEGAAKVKNIFIDDSQFITDKTSTQYAIGGVSVVVSGNAVLSASEARTRIDITTSGDNTFAGGIAGKIESGGTVHSAIGLPEITGTSQYMGGLVGQNLGNLYNSFANPKFPNATTAPYYDMPTDHYIGGLVGENGGTVENCYSRLQGDEPTSNGTASVFGWLAGTNVSITTGEPPETTTTKGTIQYCYAPQGKTTYIKGTNDGILGGHGNYGPTTLVSEKYGFKHRDQLIYRPNDQTNPIAQNYEGYAYVTQFTNNNFVGGLQMALNNWVSADAQNSGKTYHPWMRPMATTINDDLPIHKFQVWTENGGGGSKEMVASSLYNAVGSKDKVYLEYDNDANALLAEYVALDPSDYPTPAVYLYAANTTTPEPNITVTNIGTHHPNVMFAINEHVGITQDVTLKARVGVTLINSRAGNEDQTNDPNWHLFSSALQNVPLGLVYHYGETQYDPNVDMTSISGYSNANFVDNITNKPYHPHVVWNNRNWFDPPTTTWDMNAPGYFPTNTPYGTWRGQQKNHENYPDVDGFYDFYAYSEPYYHWINFKRGTPDHWHLDTDGQPDQNHFNIPYQNEDQFETGKGYLLALSSQSMLMADGELNTGEKTIGVTSTAVGTNSPNLSGYDDIWRKINLIGNPYQSYLDFDEFLNDNGTSLAQPTYGVRDDDDYSYKFYTKSGSKNSIAPGQYIHPHQGFFVKVNRDATMKFKDKMRKAGAELSPYRGGLDYPLVNLLCTDEKGKGDYTTVEIGRPDEGGAEKMKNLHIGDGLIYARWNDTDYQTLFAPVGVSTVPVRFKTDENGMFTITWTLENGLFNYVHLIDNLTGADVDCLTATEYKFEGKKSDYLSRFKLVFDVVGVDENDDDDENGTHSPFAFVYGEELVVNGDGYVEMFDVTGRRLMTGRAVGGQTSFGMPKVAAGVYVLRLTGNGKTRTQKMVIERN